MESKTTSMISEYDSFDLLIEVIAVDKDCSYKLYKNEKLGTAE